MKNLSITRNEINPVNSNNINQSTYIGIDFGTSTTVVSLAYMDWQTKQVKTQTLSLNQKLSDGAIYKSDKIPTMIAWHKQQLLVGEGASQIRLKKTKNKNIWYAFKMDLGKKNEYLYSASELTQAGRQIINGKNATTIFFKYLYQQINKFITDNHFPEQVHYSVSIPASFEPNQRKDMLEALKANHFSFKEQAFIDEPNAAFLSYISDPELQKNIHLSDEFNSNVLVFDFGAGTCDISIMEIGVEDNKFHSSNLAISKFDFIGGKQIDQLIATDVLLPQLLKENNLNSFFFSPRELQNFIIPKLERYAELLKINACKTLELAWDNINIDSYDNNFSLSAPIEFELPKGTYRITTPSMSIKQFQEIMDVFTDLSGREVFRNNKNERFISVFSPINTALEKAKLNSNSIDYVLFIGGSSKNPLIQHAIKAYFPHSTYLIPRDLQAHVSIGAAVNSLLYNGFSEQIISPIINEPIFLIVGKKTSHDLIEYNDRPYKSSNYEEDNTDIVPIIPAGAPIPSQTVTISNLKISNNNQGQIELPICLTEKTNIIQTLVIPSAGITNQDDISLQITIDANRTIHATLSVKNISTTITINNALSMPTTGKEKIEKAEADLSKATIENNGKSPSEQLYKLYQLYQTEGEKLKAAEVAEELHKHYSRISLNQIGLLYSDAGENKKAIHFYQEELKNKPSATVWFNLACQHQYKDKAEYIRCLEQSLNVEPTFGLSRYQLLKYKIAKSPTVDLKNQLNSLFLEWQSDYDAGIFPFHISWLISCAKETKNYEYAEKLEKLNKAKVENSLFNANNLVVTE